MDDVYNNINGYNPNRKIKILIVFDDKIANKNDIMTSKIFQAIIKQLFIRCRKLNLSLVFITQPYFSVSKEVRLNSTHYLIMKIRNKRELLQIAFNHSADIDCNGLIKICGKFTSQPFSFLAIHSTLPANPFIIPLSSKELDKYEYLTDEDLGYKRRVVE